MAEPNDGGRERDTLFPNRWISIDWDQTERVLGTLLERFEAEGFPYNNPNVRLPQDPRHMPETLPLGGVEHAMFLWSVCYYMRGGIRSNDAVRMLSTVYDAHPDFFVAGSVQDVEPEVVAGVLESHGLGFQHKNIGRYWVDNAKMLTELYDGDPRQIFDGVTDYSECLERIQNRGSGRNRRGFYGFQEKMVSMITYFLMDEELIDDFVFPLPVDLHVLRVSIENEMLRFNGYTEDDNLYSPETLATLRELYEEYARRHNISPLRLCDAVWLLSNALCRQQPGNVTFEPLGRDARNGRATELVVQVADVNNPAHQAAYDRSCRECPLQETCAWNVPSKEYYVRGKLRRAGRRIRFPLRQGTLFNLQYGSGAYADLGQEL
jgi:hypothetical protein